ncbi:hypothetical protein EWM64_g1233 [Hericium alpestre]|uniref:Homeobox domain-containing protein n=1 Tax=Hericium alpestre TaxID=135208 RepID=A0A4Z0A933_9AGAM|nr:hypothetical protein EWM64_g1233 [Hericium alpestre]
MRITLAIEDKAELDKLWALDKRMPSIESRRAWAKSRDLKAGAVHAWFYYMRHRHNKAGGGLAEGAYDLPISPYTPVITPDTTTSLCDERARKRLKKAHAAQSSEPSTDYMLSDSSTAVGSTEPTTPRNFDGDQYLDCVGLHVVRHLPPVDTDARPALAARKKRI